MTEVGRSLRRRKRSILIAVLAGLAVSVPLGLEHRGSLPEAASWDMRPTTLVLGSLGGLAVGLALAALGEYRDSSVMSAEEAERTLAIPVLGEIPLMSSECERRTQRRLRWAIGGVILAGWVVALAVWAMRP